jgi:hypothetical protein
MPSVYIVDDFEPGTDNWTTAKDGGSLSNIRTGIVGSPNAGLYGSYALGVTGEAWAETGSYFGFSAAQKTFGPADFSSYATLDLAASEKITFTPLYGGSVVYKVKIKSGANLIETTIPAPTASMANISLPLTGFALPSGAVGYTAASVLANADGIIIEVDMVSGVLNDWVGYEIYLDNIEFKK